MEESQKLLDFTNINGKKYIVKFPNVGQIMDIEDFKMTLSRGKYVELALSPLKIHVFQCDLIDAMSYFTVLSKDIKEDFNLNNVRDVDLKIGKGLIDIYKEQFIPWFAPIMNELTTFMDESKNEENEDSNEENQSE